MNDVFKNLINSLLVCIISPICMEHSRKSNILHSNKTEQQQKIQGTFGFAHMTEDHRLTDRYGSVNVGQTLVFVFFRSTHDEHLEKGKKEALLSG